MNIGSLSEWTAGPLRPRDIVEAAQLPHAAGSKVGAAQIKAPLSIGPRDRRRFFRCTRLLAVAFRHAALIPNCRHVLQYGFLDGRAAVAYLLPQVFSFCVLVTAKLREGPSSI